MVMPIVKYVMKFYTRLHIFYNIFYTRVVKYVVKYRIFEYVYAAESKTHALLDPSKAFGLALFGFAFENRL